MSFRASSGQLGSFGRDLRIEGQPQSSMAGRATQDHENVLIRTTKSIRGLPAETPGLKATHLPIQPFSGLKASAPSVRVRPFSGQILHCVQDDSALEGRPVTDLGAGVFRSRFGTGLPVGWTELQLSPQTG